MLMTKNLFLRTVGQSHALARRVSHQLIGTEAGYQVLVDNFWGIRSGIVASWLELLWYSMYNLLIALAGGCHREHSSISVDLILLALLLLSWQSGN